MSTADAWTYAIETELKELLNSEAILTDGDLWRILTLLGRASQHPTPPQSLEDQVDRVAQAGLARRALARSARPIAEAVLDALDAALLSGGDPAGRLADTLLDMDDLLTVLELEGRMDEAEALAAHAEALIDLTPWSAAALDEWAVRRLATVSEDMPSGKLWTAVLTASATAVLGALPTRRSSKQDTGSILDRAGGPMVNVIPLWSSTPTVRRAWRAAAADYAQAWMPAEGEDWTTYDEDGVTYVQVEARGGGPVPKRMTLVVEASGKRWTTRLTFHRLGVSSVWFRLGTEQELAVLFDHARAEIGVGLGDPRVLLEWEQDGQ